MKTENLIFAKSVQALASAKILLDSGDADGACNRAYYAMFDAARAALLSCGHEVGKTHKGILNIFSEHLVKSGCLPKEMGRTLKQAETRRYIADYDGNPVQIGDAKQMVEQAETFISAIQPIILGGMNNVCESCGTTPCICNKDGSSGGAAQKPKCSSTPGMG